MKQKPLSPKSLAPSHTGGAHTHTHTCRAQTLTCLLDAPLPQSCTKALHRHQRHKHLDSLSCSLPPPDSCTPHPSLPAPYWGRVTPPASRRLLNLMGWCCLMARMRASLVPSSSGKGPGSLCSPLSLQQGYIQSCLRRMRLSLISKTFQTNFLRRGP